MSNGRRYDGEKKLNVKKVLGVIIAIAVLIMIGFSIKMLLDPKQDTQISSKTYYFAAYSNSKWGVINSTGAEVIPFEYEEMIIVPNDEKDVFITTVDLDSSAGTY